MNPVGMLAADTKGNPIKKGFAQAGNRAYTRTVSRDATVKGQMADLLNKENDPYLNNARARGTAAAAKRGMLFTGAAAGAAEEAALNAALPIAGADASTYDRSELADQAALNDAERSIMAKEIADAQSNAAAYSSSTAVNIAASQRDFDRQEAERERQWRTQERLGTQDYGTSREREGRQWSVEDRDLGYDYGRETREDDQGFRAGESEADRRFRIYESQNDRNFQSAEARANRDWQTSTQEREYANQNYAAIRGTIFSDPTIWRDPAGAAGMAEFFSALFPRIMQQYYGGGG